MCELFGVIALGFFLAAMFVPKFAIFALISLVIATVLSQK